MAPQCIIVLHVAGDADSDFLDSPTLPTAALAPSPSKSFFQDLSSDDFLAVPGGSPQQLRKFRPTLDRRSTRRRAAWTTAPDQDPDAEQVILVPNDAFDIDTRIDTGTRRNCFFRRPKFFPPPKTKTQERPKTRRRWIVLERIFVFGLVVAILLFEGVVYAVRVR